MVIRRRDALRQMEVKEDGRGNGVLFALQFYTKKGEVRFFRHARVCGVREGVNQKEQRIRNIQECDREGYAIGHPVMISIDNIREFNGQRVVL